MGPGVTFCNKNRIRSSINERRKQFQDLLRLARCNGLSAFDLLRTEQQLCLTDCRVSLVVNFDPCNGSRGQLRCGRLLV